MKMAIEMGIGCIVAIVMTVGPGAAQTGTKASKAEQHFIMDAVQGDISEVSMGKLAQQNGQSDGIKQFGKMLEQDHSEHLQKTQQMASQLGINPPTAASPKAKATYNRLSKLSGAAFDKQFAQDMIKDHKEDIAEYQKEAGKRSSPLAEFARQTIPTLQTHLKAAQSLTPGR